MKCPVCSDASLAMMDRQGVEIDYCPQCRGVWLDRGELDKLIELATVQSNARPSSNSRPDFVDSDHDILKSSRGSHSSYGYQPRRKKSWLNDIFD
jgi:uncharacterized protein